MHTHTRSLSSMSNRDTLEQWHRHRWAAVITAFSRNVVTSFYLHCLLQSPCCIIPAKNECVCVTKQSSCISQACTSVGPEWRVWVSTIAMTYPTSYCTLLPLAHLHRGTCSNGMQPNTTAPRQNSMIEVVASLCRFTKDALCPFGVTFLLYLFSSATMEFVENSKNTKGKILLFLERHYCSLVVLSYQADWL